MTCGFCGHIFDESDGKQGCGGCGGGCRAIHCPRCGYGNPRETGIVRLFRSMKKKERKDLP